MAVEFMRAALKEGDEPGTFRAVASARDSIANGERGPTRFSESAFASSLERSTRYPLLWQHRDDSPIGVADLSMGEDGLVLSGTLALDVQQAKEARELMKIGALDGVSIGFNAERARMEVQSGKPIRVVEQARLVEVSLVTFPADPNARVQTVHAAATEDRIGFAVEELHAEVERHEGKVFSEFNLAKIRSALSSLVDLVEKVDPGHIRALGRRAAQAMRKSIVFAPSKAQKARTKASLRDARLRAVELHMTGIEDVPLLKLNPVYPYPQDAAQEERALMDALYGASQFPDEARRALTVEACKQYLVAVGDAEEIADGESDAAEGGHETNEGPEDGTAA
jgi:hypothetical protein